MDNDYVTYTAGGVILVVISSWGNLLHENIGD